MDFTIETDSVCLLLVYNTGKNAYSELCGGISTRGI